MSEEYYYSKGKKIPLEKSATQKAIKLDNKTEEGKSKNESYLEANSDKFEKSLGDNIYIIGEQNVRGGDLEFESVKENVEGKALNVYEKKNIETAVLADEFIVKFKKDTPEEEIDKVLSDGRFEHKKIKFGVNRYLLKLKNLSDYDNLLEIINSLYADNDFVEYAQPNFKRVIKKQSYPEDPEFNSQWALNKDGFDINVKKVWERNVKGDGITIAIIDSGVDYSHEDFQGNGKLAMPGYDVIFETDDPSPVPGDSHGTWCAGIAGATGNNNIGICGVAPECKILGIRVGSENPDGSWNTDDIFLANGILAAMDRGADVLSNSWGCAFESDHIELAIEIAKTEGRNGKGCVICFAAGNYEKVTADNDRSVLFPGTLSDLVITVGACNEEGKWVGEKPEENWESRYGPEVKLCAPGTAIRTTDLMGLDGGGTGNYINFRGTSAATPIVAGVAALILSKEPGLTADEVEQRLIDTADPLNSNPPEKTGKGRVNADKAVPV